MPEQIKTLLSQIYDEDDIKPTYNRIMAIIDKYRPFITTQPVDLSTYVDVGNSTHDLLNDQEVAPQFTLAAYQSVWLKL